MVLPCQPVINPITGFSFVSALRHVLFWRSPQTKRGGVYRARRNFDENGQGHFDQCYTRHFRFATLSFLFILFFAGFSNFLRDRKFIVGIIFTVRMSASMVRDLTGAPVKHFLIQPVVLVLMAVSACFVVYGGSGARVSGQFF